jgi:SHS2 domain-containing protein
MKLPRYRQLAHTADVRLAVWGDDEVELIRNAIAGALALAFPGLKALEAARRERITPWPLERERQLVTAVNEALFWLYTRRHVTVGYEEDPTPALILAPLPPGHVPDIEIKAATFHDLGPRRKGHRLRAILTLDL